VKLGDTFVQGAEERTCAAGRYFHEYCCNLHGIHVQTRGARSPQAEETTR
jgi:hypothetical protein